MQVYADPATLRDVRKLLDGISGGADTAIMRSINRSLAGVRTDATAEIFSEINLTKRKIREQFKLKKASRKNLTASIRAAHKPIPLYDKSKPWGIRGQTPGMHFKGRRLKKGFSLQVKKGQARKTLSSAFVATMKSGHTGIWVRIPGTRKIKEIYSSSVAEIFSNKERMEPILKKAGERLLKNLGQQVNFLLGL